MASILDPITHAVHGTASALLDQEVPTKLAGAVNGFVSAGFSVVTQVLTVVRDLTATRAQPTPNPTPPTNP